MRVDENFEMPEEFLPLMLYQKYFYSKQLDYLDSVGVNWITLFLGGNGTGKSLILYWNLCALALGVHPHQYVDPPLAIKVLINDFEHGYGKIFAETCLEDHVMFDGRKIGPLLKESSYMVKSWPSRDDKTIYFHNGSKIFFQTSEQKKRLHSGTNFDILGCDEEPEEAVFDESMRGLRNAKGGGRILMSFTPPFSERDLARGPSWTKFKLLDPFETGDDEDINVIRASVYENPAISDAFIRKFSKGKTDEALRIQLYGEYPTFGEMVFKEFEDYMWDPERRKGHLLPVSTKVPWNDPDASFEMSVDWHSSKAPAIIWLYEWLAGPMKGDIIVFDELSPLHGKGLTIQETCDVIKQIEGDRKGIRRFGDPKMKDKDNAIITGFCAWDKFREHNIMLHEAWNRDPATGYDAINSYLMGKSKRAKDHPRLFIRENCRTLRHNMKNHHWVKSGGVPKPDAKFSDYCVGVKYIIQEKEKRLRRLMGNREKMPLTSYGDYYAPKIPLRERIYGNQYAAQQWR